MILRHVQTGTIAEPATNWALLCPLKAGRRKSQSGGWMKSMEIYLIYLEPLYTYPNFRHESHRSPSTQMTRNPCKCQLPERGV